MPPCITAPHLGAQPNRREPMLGGLASEYSPNRLAPTKVQVNNQSSFRPGQDRGYFLATEVGPQPERAANSQRDLKWRGLKDLIVCQRGIGPAAEVAADLIQAAAPGPAGHPRQCAANGEYAGPRPVKAPG